MQYRLGIIPNAKARRSKSLPALMTRLCSVFMVLLALTAISSTSWADECLGGLPPGTIFTVAGGGEVGDGGPALQARFGFPPGVAVDFQGNVYIGDETEHTVRKIDATTGIITAVAGISGDAGFSGDGGLATDAELNLPSGVAVDFDGNLFIADRLNHRIRKVDAATGIITTVAGIGDAPFTGNGIATESSLRLPVEVGLDRDGNLYIADQYHYLVRKVVPGSDGVITGDDPEELITTVAGIPGAPGYNGDNRLATNAKLNLPADVVVDVHGNIYIADKGNHRIRRVDVATGKIRTIAGTGVRGFSGDGGPAKDAQLSQPAGMAWDRTGNLYITDASNNRIRKIEAETLIITTYAGSGKFGFGGDGAVATDPSVKMILITGFATPGVAVDVEGNLYFIDRGNQRLRKVAAGTRIITTIAGGGDVGDGGAVTDANLVVPAGVFLDNLGNMFIADRGNNLIRKVVPGADGVFTGADDEIITPIAGTGIAGFSGDGGPATEAQVMLPMAVIGDNQGNIYFTDQFNARIRWVNPGADGVVTGAADETVQTVAGTVGGFGGDGAHARAAKLKLPQGIALDNQGNLFIADQNNNRIRRVVPGPDGIVNGRFGEKITTVVGTGESGFNGDNIPGIQAKLNKPGGIFIDEFNNLFIADKDTNIIRKVDPGADGVITGELDEIITIVAGTAMQKGFSGDGGQATLATLGLPTGVGVDLFGNLYIADFQNNVVRKVTPGADGVVMGDADEIITTVAGVGGSPAFEGDCGPAIEAKLDLPLTVVPDSEGNIYIGDVPNSRVRKVILP